MIRSPSLHRWLPLAALGGSLAGCELLIPQAPPAEDLLSGPLPGLSGEELASFLRGDEAFGRSFAPSQGLGPIFNNVSCASCHSADGRGRPEHALVRFGEAPGFYSELGGPQLQDRAVPGATPEQLPPGMIHSVRLPPPVFGMGLIEAIPDAAILAHADPEDANGDGISGRANWVAPHSYVPGGAGPSLGRLGRKAQTSSLLQQVVEAYHQDMGITTPYRPDENLNPLAGESPDRVADPELGADEVRAVLAYVRGLAPPAPGAATAGRQRGEQLFAVAGCTGCHVPELRTGTSPIAALRDQPVRLYSDLLLHDLGEGLDDRRGDGQATGREWRTTPLWGLRVMRQYLNGQAFLMHDGSARSVEEAILLHGGEALRARDAFAALPAADRSALIDFVESR
jgi:CxxC motif-containing protein (DUF1111 family)